MKKLYTLIAICTISCQIVLAQNFGIVLVEDFETGALPTDWTRSQALGSDGWTFGWTGYSSSFWDIPASVDASLFAASNDDECDCDMSDDQLNSPTMNFTHFDSVYILFDRFYDGAWDSQAYMQISYDGGTTWLYLAITADPAWVEDGYAIPRQIVVDNVTYTFNDQMKIGFLHYDGEVWASGFAIDNFIVAGFNDPCDDIITIADCGVPQTVTLGGQGVLDFNFTGACGWDVPGAEQIYSFTPSTTGAHTINVSAATEASWLDYMYKPASAGCDSLGWICVNDVIAAGEYGAMNLNAGTEYLILVDNEFADTETQTFTIECPCTYDGIYSTIESETCGADLNGGCNDLPAVYEPISCGQILTGSVWADAGSRDLDWYEIVVTEATDIEVEFGGDLPLNGVLFDNCTDQNVLTSAVAGACDINGFTYAATPGTYLLLVGPTTFNGYPCAGGLNEYDLYVNYCAPPANDECAGAQALTVGTTCTYTAGDVTGATESVAGCAGSAEDDVWFSFVATSSEATVDVLGSSIFDAVVEVFQATCSGPSLDCVDETLDGELETVELTGLTIGVAYYVRVYDWYGSVAPTTGFDICVYSSPITGIDNMSSLNAVVYPNPSNGSFTLEMNGAEGTGQLMVTDMVGRTVYSERVVLSSNYRKEMNLNLSSGSYILSVISSDTNLVQKIEVK